MTTESPSQVIEQSSEDDKRPPPLSCRVVAFLVSWFFSWPVLVYAYLPSITPPASTLKICLLGAGTFLWLVSCLGIYSTLVDMAEARWPVVRPIRKALGFLFGILRSFGGHHSS
jgi:hypothetical protein